MASQLSDRQPLDLQLYDEYDDEEDLYYKKRLESLVLGEITPAKAASNFDAWVTTESSAKLDKLKQRPNGRKLTAEEEERGVHERAIAPNASGYIEMVFPTIARLLSAFPPSHPGQDSVIQFLEALRALPKHEAPDGINAEPGGDDMIILWPFGGSWMALTEVFRRVADDLRYPFGIAGSEGQLRWRNYQSAIARITSAELVDCGFLCALGDILPSSSHYPDLDKNKIGGPNRIGGNVFAGAHWLIWPDQGRFVYQQCKLVEKVDSNPRAMWSMERWKHWKEQFAFVAGDDRFDPKAQLLANLASQQMAGYEEEDTGSG